jgi:hypothetical protein
MFDFLNQLHGDDLTGVIILCVLAGTTLIIGVTVTIATYLYKLRRDEINAQLKHDMLNRGMSADEIKTVLEAGTKSGK